jgi:hypothetical protein
MLFDSTPQEERDDRQSPVDVVLDIRKELAEFQRTSSSKAFREKIREELNAACKAALRQAAESPGGLNIKPIVEYLQERGLIKLNSRRIKIRNRAIDRANGWSTNPRK